MIIAEKLLEEVQEIYSYNKAKIKQSGEEFNVFKILGLSYFEVRTHTAFLFDLLNPDGSHGMGDIFLKAFIKMLEKKYCTKWSIQNFFQKGDITVEKEKSIGPIDKDYTEGGNVDLIIRNCEKKTIIIENKINAKDQFNQLLRYYNYGKKNSKGFELIYLTLDGKEPSEFSTGMKLNKNDYKKLSYSDEFFLGWLHYCIESAKDHPFIPQTIGQYINLIKLLTGNTNNKEMEQNLQNAIIENESKFNAARIISEQYNTIISELMPDKIRNEIFEEWEKEFIETDLLLFEYEEYRIFASISEEEDWHFQIWPLKNGEFGNDAANDEKISFIRSATESLKKEFDNFPGNGNYSIWLYPSDRFNKLGIDKRLKIYKSRDTSDWTKQLLNQSSRWLKSFIQDTVNERKEISEKINWNMQNIKIQEMVSNQKNK